MRTALIVGGTGQIGRAAAQRLAGDGWQVTLAARNDADVDFPVRTVDRTEPGALEAVVGDGIDLLVDVIPFTAADAQQVVALRGRVGSVIAVSSAAVYADAEGLTFDSQEEGLFPHFRVPIGEREPTCPPGDDTYSRRKRAVELALLEHEDLRATVVRPGAIHGLHGRFPREWYFVKRILDGRRAVILARRGASRFHTTSTENLAELIRLAAERPDNRVLNAGDPDPPNVLEISRAIASALEHEWTEVLLPSPDEPCETPWTGPRPFVLDMTEAEFEVGYRPVTRYERAVQATCEWLVEYARGRPWEEVAPSLVRHRPNSFDYEAEDKLLAELSAG
jgi:nucleoside-diphosphate-sugar epimerase